MQLALFDWHPSRSSFERGQKSESRRGVRVEKNLAGNADLILNIAAPLLLRGLQMHGREGRGFVVVSLGLDLAARADTPPLFHKQEAAEQVALDVEAVEAAHVPRRIDAAKFNRVHRLPADGRESSGQIVGLTI
jgi:hypothetical protein